MRKGRNGELKMENNGENSGHCQSTVLTEGACNADTHANCNLFGHKVMINLPENSIEVSVSVELRAVRIMAQGDLNLQPLWRDQQL